MTLVQDLPIFRATYELVSLITDYTASFPKLYKFSIGSRMIDTALSLFEFIQLANRCGKDKGQRAKYLQSFLLKFELLKILIRICNEKKILSLKQTSRLAELTCSIGKQATAWKNS